MKNDLYDGIDKVIKKADTIVLASHVNPDGDNLGSTMAVYNMLKQMKKKVYAICNDPIPKDFLFLPNIKDIVTIDEYTDKDPDLFITLDSADLDRLGKTKELFKRAKHSINIDHHRTNTNYATYNLVHPKTVATGEVLFELIEKNKYPLDKDIATCIYTAISSDSGSFKYDSVTPRTHIIASILLGYNIDINEITKNLYQSRSKEKTRLLIETMSNIEYYNDGKIGLITINKNLFEKTGAKPEDSEGLVEFVRDTEGIEIAILLKEKENSVKISMRSKNHVDVSVVASKFNGGGHSRAAGGTIYKNTTEAKKELIDEIMRVSNAGNTNNQQA